jgi:hypothetical protein
MQQSLIHRVAMCKPKNVYRGKQTHDCVYGILLRLETLTSEITEAIQKLHLKKENLGAQLTASSHGSPAGIHCR